MTINMSDNKEFFTASLGLPSLKVKKKKAAPPAYFFQEVTGNTPIFFLALPKGTQECTGDMSQESTEDTSWPGKFKLKLYLLMLGEGVFMLSSDCSCFMCCIHTHETLKFLSMPCD